MVRATTNPPRLAGRQTKARNLLRVVWQPRHGWAVPGVTATSTARGFDLPACALAIRYGASLAQYTTHHPPCPTVPSAAPQLAPAGTQDTTAGLARRKVSAPEGPPLAPVGRLWSLALSGAAGGLRVGPAGCGGGLVGLVCARSENR